tara:strand:+ start:546 stop:1139 length:594 start_codon:yes stop_codon:yes gene_type:complete
MLKKVLIFSVISSSALISPIAMADSDDSGFYISAGIGTGLETDIDGSIDGTSFSGTGRTTFSGGIGLGYEFDSNLRIEAGVSRTTADVDSVNVSGINYAVDESGTGNGLGIGVAYDFENGSIFTPFVGASYGISWSDDADDSSNSYGIDFGLSIPVSNNLEVWGAIGLGISPEQTIDSVSYDTSTAWGFSTGLRIRI